MLKLLTNRSSYTLYVQYFMCFGIRIFSRRTFRQPDNTPTDISQTEIISLDIILLYTTILKRVFRHYSTKKVEIFSPYRIACTLYFAVIYIIGSKHIFMLAAFLNSYPGQVVSITDLEACRNDFNYNIFYTEHS